MSLHGTYDANNIFAKILRGEAPAVKVFEDDEALAIMDIFPQTRGHMLVIPKQTTARNLLEFPSERLGALMAHAQRLAKAADKALRPDGVAIVQFNGAPAGQTVFHLHVHVIPRYEGQKLAGHSHSNMADVEELKRIAAEIVAAL